MIEVAIALGVISFALLSVVALLPQGINSNRVSGEETRAVCILSAMEADLRNTHPAASNGVSRLFGFQLPYGTNASGGYVINPSLTPTTSLGAGFTTGLNDSELPVPLTPRPRYQASVLYTEIPPAGSTSSVKARLVVNWPPVSETTIAAVTDTAKTSGVVETIVSFPTP